MTRDWTAAERLYKRAFDAIERLIEDRYALPVVITDVLDPNTGDFDGTSIKLDYANDLETSLFVLAHLFGHTVQWATNPRYRELGTKYGVETPPVELYEEIRLYEQEASRYSLRLFHDAGLEELDQWLSDWAHADWCFLDHFYQTGERVDFRTFFEAGAGSLIEPLEIPSFEPEKWVSRWSF